MLCFVRHLLCFLFIGLALPLASRAQIRLPEIFNHHMVLQRGLPIPAWGTAGRGAALELSLGQHVVRAKADGSGN